MAHTKAPFKPHEILWIVAANELKGRARAEAFWDIAEMSGRQVFSVMEKAKRLRTMDKKIAKAFLEVARRKEWAMPRRVFVSHGAQT